MNWCYILRCADGSLYTGWTNDLEKRLAAHNAGTESFESKEAAMSREWHIKRLTRAEKLALIDREKGGREYGNDA